MTERKRSKAEERAYVQLREQLYDLDAVREQMVRNLMRLKLENMPLEWESTEDRAPTRPHKVRINASYDEDVARFFRSLGAGYQARMNAVLRAYMFGVLSREVRMRRNLDWKGEEI